MLLLNWYSYSITGIWNCLGNLFTESFALLRKIDMSLNVFYILLISVLFVGWMFVMRNYYKDHRDKGLLQ